MPMCDNCARKVKHTKNGLCLRCAKKPFVPHMRMNPIQEPKFLVEQILAHYFKANNVRARYEFASFWYSTQGRFTPDFYLLDNGLYLEISNTRQAYHQSKKRILRVMESFQNIHIKVVRRTGKTEDFYNGKKRELTRLQSNAIKGAVDSWNLQQK